MSFVGELYFFFLNGKVVISTKYLICFRLLFSGALLLKYIIEITRGFPNHVKPHHYQYFVNVKGSALNEFASKVYIITFHLRPILALLLLSGIQVHIAAFLAALSYCAELFCLFRYHLIIILFTLLFIVLDKVFDDLPSWYDCFHMNVEPSQSVSSFIVFIKLLIIVSYISSAYRKWQHRFWDGFVLREGAVFSIENRDRKFKDHFSYFTVAFSKKIIIEFSKYIASFVIVAELLVALLLLCGEPFKSVGVVCGILLHIGMMMLFPITLSFFSLIMTSILILWL